MIVAKHTINFSEWGLDRLKANEGFRLSIEAHEHYKMLQSLRGEKMNVGKPPTFIESETIEDANKVDIEKYRLIERLSAERNKFVFIKRANR